MNTTTNLPQKPKPKTMPSSKQEQLLAVEAEEEEEDSPPSILPCSEAYMAKAEELLERDAKIGIGANADEDDEIWGSRFKDGGNDDEEEKNNAVNNESSVEQDCYPDDVTPRMIKELYNEIDNLTDKPTYDLTNQGLRSKYIHRRDMLIKFLRAERYDASRAADRLNCFLDTSFEYFGPQALIRPVRISDLTRTERDLLKSGRFQILSGRTRTGRRIAFNYEMACPKAVTETNVARVVFYYLQNLSDDEITQRRGLDVVDFVPSNFSLRTVVNDSHARKTVFKVISRMPIRLSMIHVCLPQIPSSRAIKAILTRTNGLIFRQHVRFHVSTPSEAQKILDDKYSIPHDLLPFMYDGKVKLKTHNRWVNIRMTLDDMQQRNPEAFDKAVQSGAIIECPNNADVCGGKGQVIQSSPGNVAMRQLLEETIDEYNQAESRNDKSNIISRIVKEIQGLAQGRTRREPGKFLNQHPSGLWYVKMTEKEALAKVSMAFRDVRKKIASERRLEARRHLKAKREDTEFTDGVRKTVQSDPTSIGIASADQALPQHWPSLKMSDESNPPSSKRRRMDEDDEGYIFKEF